MSDEEGPSAAGVIHTIAGATAAVGEQVAPLATRDDPADQTGADVARGFAIAGAAAAAAEQGARAIESAERGDDPAGAAAGGIETAAATGGLGGGVLDAIGQATGDRGFRDAARVVRAGSALASAAAAIARQVAGGSSGGDGAAVRYELAVDGTDAEWRLRTMSLVEALDEPYRATLEVRCDEPDADARELLGRDAELLVTRGDRARRLSGIVQRVVERDDREHGVSATLEVVPALYALGQNQASVIFQEQTAVEILEAVLTAGLSPYGREVDASGLSATYAPREFCVQYRESDLAFARRLMEEEGIGSYFDFEGEGPERLVLFDDHAQLEATSTSDGAAVPFAPRGEVVGGREPITRLEPSAQLTATALTSRDYDWTRGETRLESAAEGEDERGRAREVFEHGHGQRVTRFEFQAGGRYGGNDVERLAGVRREALVRDAAVCSGESRVIGLSPGRTFEITGHPTPGLDQRYVVTRVTHESHGGDGAEGYSNRFECAPFETPWRPTRRTPKPAIYGVQTAVVTGGERGEIRTDEYGRVQVRFHWDRSDRGGRDGSSASARTSCWIRVAQVWGGHDGSGHPGFLFIPRVGMEVIVTFLGGDPDRPLVTGSVYNGTNLPPAALPDEASRSIIRTRSLGGDGYNELSFEDASGREEVHLRAERNLRELVQNDHGTHVLNDQENIVDGNQTELVCGSRKQTIEGFDRVQVLQSRRTDVTHDDTLHVGGVRKTTVHLDDTLDVDQSHSLRVKGSTQYTLDDGWEITVTHGLGQRIVDGGWRMNTTGDVEHEVHGSAQYSYSGSVSSRAVGNFAIQANGGLSLVGNRIQLRSNTAVDVIAPDGIVTTTPTERRTTCQSIFDYFVDSFSGGLNKQSFYGASLSLGERSISIARLKATVCRTSVTQKSNDIKVGDVEAVNVSGPMLKRASVILLS